MSARLAQVDLVVRDMEAAIAFYRALDLEIPDASIWRTASGIHHVDVPMPGGLVLHFDSPALARAYDRGWQAPPGRATRVVLSFHVPAREDVDRLHAKLTKLGHASAQPPYDAFWGSRFAVVEDPEGNHVGIMSPRDDAHGSAPPDL